MQHASNCPCSECEKTRKEQAQVTQEPKIEQEFVMERPKEAAIPPKKAKGIKELNDKFEWLNSRVEALERERDEKKRPKRKRAFWRSWEFYLVIIGVPGFLYALYLVWQVIEHGKKIVLPW